MCIRHVGVVHCTVLSILLHICHFHNKSWEKESWEMVSGMEARGRKKKGRQLHLEHILKGEIIHSKDRNMVVEEKISIMKNNRMSGYEFLEKKMVVSQPGLIHSVMRALGKQA